MPKAMRFANWRKKKHASDEDIKHERGKLMGLPVKQQGK